MLENYRYNHKGLYKVGSKAFTNKFEACLELNTIPGDHHLHWDYHEDLFSKANWEHEPPVSILELYKQRAIQLREHYDHLVLFYSGGADSTTILQAFVNNNIKLDEVFIHGSFKAEEKVIGKLGLSTDPGYYTRELNNIVLPTLKELQKKQNFKITIWDWTDKTIEALRNPDWFWDVGTRYAPDAISKKDFHNIFRHNDKEDKGRKVAFIYGVDKPRLFRDDKNVYFAFTDVILSTGVPNNADIDNRYWENDEYFYWSPNFPELAVKQAHMVYNFLKKTNKISMLSHINDLSGFHNTKYYKIVNRIIYPEWNIDTWQIEKPTSTVRDEVAKWFFDFGPEESKKSWLNGVKEIERQLGTRHFNQQSAMKGIKGCYSKFYKVGDITVDSSTITVDSVNMTVDRN